jgi:NAD(P)-dependent dehydrogenase (short-subunit alcohol dehydrogenase family)
MLQEFEANRAALVTGGAKRIGAAIVRALAEDGWHVVVHCNRSRDDAEALQEEIARAGGACSIVEGDLSDADAPDRILGEASAAAGPLGLLVNNASLFEYDTFEDFGLDRWSRHMDVNLRAPALLTRAFARSLHRNRETLRGLVVNLLDAKLFSLNPDYFTYTISKYGLLGLTEMAARVYAPHVRVCGIAPSVTLVSGPQSRENFEKVHGLNALGRGVEAGDIVRALRFIVATPTLTAETIRIDGGQKLLGLPRDVAFMAEN